MWSYALLLCLNLICQLSFYSKQFHPFSEEEKMGKHNGGKWEERERKEREERANRGTKGLRDSQEKQTKEERREENVSSLSLPKQNQGIK